MEVQYVSNVKMKKMKIAILLGHILGYNGRSNNESVSDELGSECLNWLQIALFIERPGQSSIPQALDTLNAGYT